MTAHRPEAWLLSAYGAASHRAWAEQLIDGQDAFSWQHLELPGRHFAWRIRGNPLSWLDALPTSTPGLIVATSMVDLATIKGLHPRLAKVPCLLYFHENQFAYPASPEQVASVEPQMVQLYGALAADRVAFNSEYNRDSFLAGLNTLLARLPDAVPADVAKRILDRSTILPVPIHPVTPGQRDDRLILWNHRWEYDKAPEVFAQALLQLAATGVGFRIALLGSQGRVVHPALAQLRRDLPDRIVADGHLEVPAYRTWLGRSGIVVSTAGHEFQGLSVLEAASAGARPLVPDALCYPEYVPVAYRYPAGDVEALTERLSLWLEDGLPPSVDVSSYTAAVLAPRWRGALEAMLVDS
ncbi:MAG: DUF3524 domain-containing protein [Gammaproteobacteria bacterium]|nr:DUF3524 domain-containing protein [Gammaproteobacteria bacterium]